MTSAMSPIEAALLVVVFALPWFWFLNWQIAKLADPKYLRERGVVIVLEKALEAHADPIGEYMGQPIWASVTFKGMRYRFDHILERKKRERLAPGELFLEPGLVYVVDSPPG
jgi:hypothetical protein